MDKNMQMKSMSIAILGTDGAGKTTVINEVKKVIDQCGFSQVFYEHMRPNWLPPLGVATGKREKSEGTIVTDPHAQSPSGFVGSLVRLFYYWLDYSLGYWVKTRSILKAPGRICIFDRYFYDLMIDPRRMRIRLPAWILRGAFIWVPQPHLVICLGAEPEVLYERKPETSMEEVSRQVADLKELASKTKNAVWVDTGQDISSSVMEVLKAIKDYQGGKY